MTDRRALLFDVGNTRLKWGVLRNDRIVRSGSIDHDKLRKQGFTPLTTRLPANIDYVLASNVAGAAFATRLAGVIGIHCNTDVHFARSEKEAYGVKNGYRQPRRLGVDRWVALVGARAETRSAVCVVDSSSYSALGFGGPSVADGLGGLSATGDWPSPMSRRKPALSSSIF